jgi:Domain of unknown function (DUF1877)
MSIVITLRRVDPLFLENLTWEQALSFAFGLDLEDKAGSDHVIPFFAQWHVIHFLSSGTRWDKSLPAGFMIGGQDWIDPMTEEGPYQILTESMVKEVAAHLESVSKDVVRSRLDLLLTGSFHIYGGKIERDEFDDYWDSFQYVGAFFKSAAEANFVVTLATS